MNWEKKGPKQNDPVHQIHRVVLLLRFKYDGLSASDHKMSSAVFLPAFFTFFRADGLFFAIADRVDPVGGDAQIHQVSLGGIGTAIAQAQVVLFASPFVAMTFDVELDTAILLEEISGTVQDRFGIFPNVGLVVIIINVSDILSEKLLNRRSGWRRRRGWRRWRHVHGDTRRRRSGPTFTLHIDGVSGGLARTYLTGATGGYVTNSLI